LSEVTEQRPGLLRVATTATVVVMFALIGIRWLNQVNLFPPIPKDASIAPRVAAERDDVTEIEFTARDGVTLYGWVQGPETATRYIIQFMGNAEYVGPGASLYGETAQALNAKFLLFDYRGFANSEGRPSEQGLYADARAAWDFAVHELGWHPALIVLWGRSLGGGVATKLAAELLEAGQPPGAVILESAFTSIPDMARALMPFLGKPGWLTYSRFDNLGRAPGLELPVMLIHGNGDEIVPFEMSKRLHEALPGPKHLLELESGHNNVWSVRSQANLIREEIDQFLQRHAT
jgi:uncharacterized protein